MTKNEEGDKVVEKPPVTELNPWPEYIQVFTLLYLHFLNEILDGFLFTSRIDCKYGTNLKPNTRLN
jgi:hypothetical protein